MRAKSVIGLAAILAAIWLMGQFNRDNFRRDTFAVCIGRAGDGPRVTEQEAQVCACMAGAAVQALPWKSRLPQSLITLDAEDNSRMIAAQKQCQREWKGVVGTASPARTGDLWIHNPAL